MTGCCSPSGRPQVPRTVGTMARSYLSTQRNLPSSTSSVSISPWFHQRMNPWCICTTTGGIRICQFGD
jgi:hypothetical protein